MRRVNPFKPRAIVSPGMFSGRTEELELIGQSLFQTKHGNPSSFLIHGERGIGKSSLMLYTRLVATGQMELPGQEPHDFITVDVELSANSSFDDIVKKIGADFSRKLRERDFVKTAAAGFWDFLKRWEVMGVRLHPENQDQEADMVVQLGDTFINALSSAGEKIDGVLVLIDEADKPNVNADLGGFLKVFTERLTKRDCHRVAIGCSGLSTVIDKLRESHPSSLRIMSHIKLEPLSDGERKEVILRGLEEANRINLDKTTIDPEAIEWVARFSEGYPHFLQQYAFSAFETDTDGTITMNDVAVGAYKENGALDQLGTNYFEEMYAGKIDSDEYRKVLKAMAENKAEYMSRQEIKSETGLKETTLGNALRALKNRRIILAHPEKVGLYKLPTGSFAVWIRARVEREKAKANLQP